MNPKVFQKTMSLKKSFQLSLTLERLSVPHKYYRRYLYLVTL